MTPTGFAPLPKTTGLQFEGTQVAPVAGGLQATMRFSPTQEDPPGIVAVVVRLPRDSETRILDLNAAGSMQFSDITKRVSEDGKFAVFQGTAQDAASFEFALSVSGSTVADVRGTAGVGPFDLEIGPLEATVTPK